MISTGPSQLSFLARGLSPLLQFFCTSTKVTKLSQMKTAMVQIETLLQQQNKDVLYQDEHSRFTYWWPQVRENNFPHGHKSRPHCHKSRPCRHELRSLRHRIETDSFTTSWFAAVQSKFVEVQSRICGSQGFGSGLILTGSGSGPNLSWKIRSGSMIFSIPDPDQGKKTGSGSSVFHPFYDNS